MIYQSIKIRKSDLIDIDCIDQLVEIDDTLISFINLSRFYRFHRIISEDTSVFPFIQKWKLISSKQWIVDNMQVAIISLRVEGSNNYHFLKKSLKKFIFSLKPGLKSFVDCKTVLIFAYSSMREQSNKRSGMRLKTESETGERR